MATSCFIARVCWRWLRAAKYQRGEAREASHPGVVVAIGTAALSSVGGMNRGGCSADFFKCLRFRWSSPCSVWMVYDLGLSQKSPGQSGARGAACLS